MSQDSAFVTVSIMTVEHHQIWVMKTKIIYNDALRLGIKIHGQLDVFPTLYFVGYRDDALL